MSRLLRWVIGLSLVLALAVAAALLLPFHSWLPGGTVADLPRAEVINGTAFNRLFPRPDQGEQLVFTQEKRGFSEAKLRRGESTLALLAISDTTTAPEARDKFRSGSERLAGWPLVDQGERASALLVADRFQVKVLAQDDDLDAAGRRQLISGFDLDGLAALAPAARRRLAPGRGGPVEPVQQSAVPLIQEPA